MNPGEVVLARLPELGVASGKLRPALILAPLPGPYQTILLCGISTRLGNIPPNWDELIKPGDPDFPRSGLHQTSVIRLSYLRGVTTGEIRSLIGSIDPARLVRLRSRLSNHLKP
jgi:mRNA interferase MazF